jgi:hypothetical protein
MPMSIKELDQVYRRTYRRLITGVLIAYGTSLLVVLALLISQPRIAAWMSEAVQAELVGTTAAPAPQPTRLAQPKGIRAVRVDQATR